MPRSPKVSLSAMLRVRSDASHLAQALNSLHDWVHHLVVLDTSGKRDQAAWQALAPGAKVIIETSNPGEDHSPRLQTLLFQAALETGADWLLALDEDEYWENGAGVYLRSQLPVLSMDITLLAMDVCHTWDTSARYRLDGLYASRLRRVRCLRATLPALRSAQCSQARESGGFFLGHLPAGLTGRLQYLPIKLFNQSHLTPARREAWITRLAGRNESAEHLLAGPGIRLGHHTDRAWALTAEPSSVAESLPLPLPELLPHIRPQDIAILHLGCGSGGLGLSIKSRQAAHLIGVEDNLKQARAAACIYDQIFNESLDHWEWPLTEGSLDLVVATDVFEKLRDPWQCLRQIQQALKPGGRFLAVVGNVRNLKTLQHLEQGVWPYAQEAAITERPLRYFTRLEFTQALSEAGFHAVEARPVKDPALDQALTPEAAQNSAFSLGRLVVQPVGGQDWEDWISSHFVYSAIKQAQTATVAGG
jgi:SAM-dependent methyltransferase